MSYSLQLMSDADRKSKLRSDDRIFVLEKIDDKAPLNSTGLVDKRLFTGENKLHAIRDPNNGLWGMRYESGGVPEALKVMFTTFSHLRKFMEDYFAKRNIRVKEVID